MKGTIIMAINEWNNMTRIETSKDRKEAKEAEKAKNKKEEEDKYIYTKLKAQ